MLLALLPLQVVALTSVAPPVEVTLHDVNHNQTLVVQIGRDGTIDDATRDTLEHAFRCRRSDRTRRIDRGLYAMIAHVAERWPGHTIEYVSAYRGWRGERKTSPHRAGRAFDFRVRGVPLTEVRDYVWATFREVGVGWYPGDGFIHMDHRAGQPDIAWTERNGKNHYHPSWATRVREGRATRRADTRVGL